MKKLCQIIKNLWLCTNAIKNWLTIDIRAYWSCIITLIKLFWLWIFFILFLIGSGGVISWKFLVGCSSWFLLLISLQKHHNVYPDKAWCKTEDDSQNEESDETSNVWWIKFISDKHYIMFFDSLNISVITVICKFVLWLFSKYIFVNINILLFHWVDFFEYIPLDWLWARWGCERSFIGPSVWGIKHLHEFSNFEIVKCYWFIIIQHIPLLWFKEFIDDFNFSLVKFFCDFLWSIE